MRNITGAGSEPLNLTPAETHHELMAVTNAFLNASEDYQLISVEGEITQFDSQGFPIGESEYDPECDCQGTTTYPSVAAWWGPDLIFGFSNELDSIHSFDNYEYNTIMRRQGASLVEAQSKNNVIVFYGGWLAHSYFHVYNLDAGHSNANFIESRARGRHWQGGWSKGNTSKTPLTGTGSLTWNGIMAGVTTGETRGEFIQGDTSVEIDNLSAPDVDVAFTNVRNIETGASLDNLDWNWSDMALEDLQDGNSTPTIAIFRSLSDHRLIGIYNDNVYQTGPNDDHLQGTFYGPDHEEVGGTFERHNIRGAFGATQSQ